MRGFQFAKEDFNPTHTLSSCLSV